MKHDLIIGEVGGDSNDDEVKRGADDNVYVVANSDLDK